MSALDSSSVNVFSGLLYDGKDMKRTKQIAKSRRDWHLKMKAIDVIFNLLIPLLILLHLLIAPYSKVEESFNIQATHDIVTYGLPIQNISSSLQATYDHPTFSGAVPRTFVGALALAGLSKPILLLTSEAYGQFVVRAVLGLFNAFAIVRWKGNLEKAFGREAVRWYILLQAAQFHVIYYASRTLPNMFAFGFTTIAMSAFLPTPGVNPEENAKRQRIGIFFFVFAGVVFRSEIAILLFTQLLVLLVQNKISPQNIIPAGISSALVALAISVPIDSYFWQKPIWPELAGFYYNAIQGKSVDWGTSPYSYYFSTLLSRLLLNPAILMMLIPLSFSLPATKYQARDLVIPSVLFIAIYSLQPHKEARFIIYVVPPLTAAASLSASYIWVRRTKSILYRVASLVLITSIGLSFVASTGMLLISSLNYPGGDALYQLHKIISRSNPQGSTVNIHMDVLSCMTGVTRFLSPPSVLTTNGQQIQVFYDKNEDAEEILEPEFWEQFDYALMEEPEKAIGKWEIVGTVFAYAGIEFLRPGDGTSFGENLEKVYAANNVTKIVDGEESTVDSEDVKEAVDEGKDEHEKKEEVKRKLEDFKAKLMFQEMGRFGTWNLVRDGVRLVTGGYWVGPRMEGKIRILRRVREPLVG